MTRRFARTTVGACTHRMVAMVVAASEVTNRYSISRASVGTSCMRSKVDPSDAPSHPDCHEPHEPLDPLDPVLILNSTFTRSREGSPRTSSAFHGKDVPVATTARSVRSATSVVLGHCASLHGARDRTMPTPTIDGSAARAPAQRTMTKASCRAGRDADRIDVIDAGSSPRMAASTSWRSAGRPRSSSSVRSPAGCSSNSSSAASRLRSSG